MLPFYNEHMIFCRLETVLRMECMSSSMLLS